MLILSMGRCICGAVEAALTWYWQVKTVYKNTHVRQKLGKASTNAEQNRSVTILIAPIGQQLFIVAPLVVHVCGIYFLAKIKALHSLEELRSTIPALSPVK